MRDILGGKGAGLAEMANLGLPVPPGFTISAKLCLTYLERGTFPDGLKEEVARHLKQLERATKRKFGSRDGPLLVSVRSGAAVSMPGMMETILNLGLNDETVQGLVADSKNPRFAYDSYRRFVQMYGDVVFDLGRQPFAEVLEEYKLRRKVERDIDLPAEDLQALVREFKAMVQAKAGAPFPDDPMQQLWGAIEAVFRSWRTRRAVDYRRIHGIPEDLGTAVNVVAMVYGNMGEDSGTGVAFTRDCSTGEKVLNGDFLVNAQGEDVASGARTRQPIAKLGRGRLARVSRELERVAQKLERHFKDVQDIEFTFERGKLYMLQTRRAQRTGLAAVRIAADMVDDGLISADEAVQRVPPRDLDQLFHPMVDPRASATLVAKGLPASPGAAIGEAVFDADLAVALAKKGRKVILVRPETSPEDFHGIVAAQAVLTARRRALAKLLPMQRHDFEGIFEAMAGLPVTIRLLDPPLHEFLPHTPEELATLAKEMRLPVAKLKRLVGALVEANPMLGHRGCRLGITYPEITEMQARAIFEAACRVGGRGHKVMVEVMIPLVADVEELRRQAEIVRRVAQEVFVAAGRGVPYLVGTMIELPRAALTADEIAKEADFFSFGTNDLTQTTFGLSRDDAGRFLPFYVERGILPEDPFQVLDQEGVGKLIEIAVRLGRGTRTDLKVGICGEHGGEPASVKFCHRVGMNYVSCSPFRVPIARLAAAQAALEEQGVINRTKATV